LIKSAPKADNLCGAGGAPGAASPRLTMPRLSISRLARACGLSRSTLLYYDRIGLLRPSGRTASSYRYYLPADRARLERVRHFREAGLTLKEIRAVLSSGGKPGTKLLEKRLRETADSIVRLKDQQRMLAGMLRRVAAGKRLTTVDTQLWVEMLEAAGMDDAAKKRWHMEFERRAPEGHREFLLSLGIPPNVAARIRSWSRGEIDDYEMSEDTAAQGTDPFTNRKERRKRKGL
jgi:DNA-binding transcriptional MerR regulator